MKKILIISTSNNKEGNSAHLAQWFEEGVNKEKYETQWVYLYDLDIPPFTNENRKALVEQDPRNKDVRMLCDLIDSVDHVVLTFPVWNFSVPGVLKNMLDRTMASGRVWSEEKQKKVPGWRGKTFYLMFTMGAPWYGLGLDSLALIQVWLTLWYFGAKRKVVGFATNCGNGSRCVIEKRSRLQKKFQNKGRKFFS